MQFLADPNTRFMLYSATVGAATGALATGLTQGFATTTALSASAISGGVTGAFAAFVYKILSFRHPIGTLPDPVATLGDASGFNFLYRESRYPPPYSVVKQGGNRKRYVTPSGWQFTDDDLAEPQ